MDSLKQTRFEAMSSILKAINSSMDLQTILDRILDAAMEILLAERGFIVITGIIEDKLIFKSARNIDKKQLKSEEMQISKGIVNEVITNKKGIISHNAMSDPRYMGNPSIIHFGLRSVIAVPLIVKGDCLGAIYLDNRFKNGIFNEEDFEFMTVFAHEAAIAMEQARLEDERNYIYEILKKYVSPSVADEILKNGLEINFRGENKYVTVMFADIRGFTSLSEKLPPQTLLKQLNEFFELASHTIFEKRGTLLKFLGDGLMSAWGAPIEDPNSDENAVKTALDIINSVNDLNKIWTNNNYSELKIGIGIHSGIATAGIIGSNKRREYSIMGDIVNTASRLESLTKEYSSDLIVSEQTIMKTKFADLFENIGPTIIRGKKSPVNIYKLI